MEYETVIGVEVHAQLRTETKMFCACANRFGAPPNTLTCPVCAGLPGALPVPGREAFDLALRTALGLSCRLEAVTRFDRKNYFYPDLPKNYQISQLGHPVGEGGRMEYEMGEAQRLVRIRRVHLEEDAGKNLHDPEGGASRIDLNRAGVPLVEIVTEPDLRSPAEARAFLQELRRILRFLGVSDGNMEEGSFRCEPNISLRQRGTDALGVKTEIKNLNSFAGAQKALAFEVERQAGILKSGGRVRPETMLWNREAGRTEPMRSKEEASDYRYFPEPDLLPVRIDPECVERIRAGLAELPLDRARRFQDDMGLSAHEARVLTQDPADADYFEALLEEYGDEARASRFLVTDARGVFSGLGKDVPARPVSPADLAGLLRLLDAGELNPMQARECLREMAIEGIGAEEARRKRGLSQLRDASVLEDVVRAALDRNPDAVRHYREGLENRAVGFLMGEIMRATKGRADPRRARALVEKALEKGARE